MLPLRSVIVIPLVDQGKFYSLRRCASGNLRIRKAKYKRYWKGGSEKNIGNYVRWICCYGMSGASAGNTILFRENVRSILAVILFWCIFLAGKLNKNFMLEIVREGWVGNDDGWREFVI